MPQSLNLILPTDVKRTPAMQNFLQNMAQIVQGIVTYGPTSDYPTTSLYLGRRYFDTTLDCEVIWNGSEWTIGSGGGGGGSFELIINGTPIVVAVQELNLVSSNTVAVNATANAENHLANVTFSVSPRTFEYFLWI